MDKNHNTPLQQCMKDMTKCLTFAKTKNVLKTCGFILAARIRRLLTGQPTSKCEKPRFYGFAVTLNPYLLTEDITASTSAFSSKLNLK